MHGIFIAVILVAIAVIAYLLKIREIEPRERIPELPPERRPVAPFVPPLVDRPIIPVEVPPRLIPTVSPAESERFRQFYAADLGGRPGIQWQQAKARFLTETQPGMPGGVSVDAIDATYRRIFRETVGVTPPPPVPHDFIGPLKPGQERLPPPAVKPVIPPVKFTPLPNPDYERIRQFYAHDLRMRPGSQWQKAYKRFLAETQPGKPGSASTDAIYATFLRIFKETPPW